MALSKRWTGITLVYAMTVSSFPERGQPTLVRSLTMRANCVQPQVELPVLLYFFPNLTGQLGHFLDILPAGFPIGIGDLGKLVCVIAESSYLVEQIGVMLTGFRTQFGPHDEGTQEFLTGQAACFHLRFQMCQFFFVEMKRDDVVSFSHMDSFNALVLSFCGFSSVPALLPGTHNG